jgi:hypothetical protein
MVSIKVVEIFNRLPTAKFLKEALTDAVPKRGIAALKISSLPLNHFLLLVSRTPKHFNLRHTTIVTAYFLQIIQ